MQQHKCNRINKFFLLFLTFYKMDLDKMDLDSLYSGVAAELLDFENQIYQNLRLDDSWERCNTIMQMLSRIQQLETQYKVRVCFSQFGRT